MTKKHFQAFAGEARRWRESAERLSTENDTRGAFAYRAMAQGIEDGVVKVAMQFNPRFDEALFRKACNLH